MTSRGLVGSLGAGKVAAAALVVVCVLLLSWAGCDLEHPWDDTPDVLETFGRTGRGDGEFIYPRAIDVAGDGLLFVVDKTGRIQRLTPAGAAVNVIRMPEIEAGKPTGLSVGPDGNVYVADTHYHRVIVFAPDGDLVREFGGYGRQGGCFIYPTDVAFGPDGQVYVTEYGGNDRVSVFSDQGEFLYSFGSMGDGRGQLARPSAVCVDTERELLYVADACNHRIAVYDLDGGLRGYIGSVGRDSGQLRYPYDLALMDDGGLLVCEYGNNRLQLFSRDGQSVATYGCAGREPGQLAYPWGVVVTSDRKAYVVDAGNDRVQVWQL